LRLYNETVRLSAGGIVGQGAVTGKNMKKKPGYGPNIEQSNFIANGLCLSRLLPAMKKGRCIQRAIAGIVVLLAVSLAAAIGQQPVQAHSDGIGIHGTVFNAFHKCVDGAVVRLDQEGVPGAVETRTNATCAFSFSALQIGSYRLSAEKTGLRSRTASVTASFAGEQKSIDLVLEDMPQDSGIAHPDSSAASSPVTQAMEFADRPNFTVAGVTDWTAVGGHGSDSTLRTSEALTRETLTLKPERPEHSGTEAGGAAEASKSSVRAAAKEHLLAGELDEKKGDPLAAVREFEQAVHLDPSEVNYFEWGSELLLHRAVWQAQQVFQRGAEAYPKSARMLTGLGTALFAGARYDEAAQQICAASDLNPASTEPYIFMGKIEIAAPDPLVCIEPKLARFADQQPGKAQANYLYAMAILKSQEQKADAQAVQHAETLLTRALQIDGKCSEAYLQLGILSASRRDFQKAISFYAKAIEANPQMSEAHYRLGVAYDRTGEHDKARQEFQLHDELKRLESEAIDRQRREVKQFLVVLPGQPADPPVH